MHLQLYYTLLLPTRDRQRLATTSPRVRAGCQPPRTSTIEGNRLCGPTYLDLHNGGGFLVPHGPHGIRSPTSPSHGTQLITPTLNKKRKSRAMPNLKTRPNVPQVGLLCFLSSSGRPTQHQGLACPPITDCQHSIMSLIAPIPDRPPDLSTT
jgi:hypothetical protein